VESNAHCLSNTISRVSFPIRLFAHQALGPRRSSHFHLQKGVDLVPHKGSRVSGRSAPLVPLLGIPCFVSCCGGSGSLRLSGRVLPKSVLNCVRDVGPVRDSSPNPKDSEWVRRKKTNCTHEKRSYPYNHGSRPGYAFWKLVSKGAHHLCLRGRNENLPHPCRAYWFLLTQSYSQNNRNG